MRYVKLPFSAAGTKLGARRGTGGDNPEERSNYERCLTTPLGGPPMVNSAYNNNIQFVQTPGAIAIYQEANHEVRIIHMDTKTHSPVPRWFGDSVGWWEGETLVVETTNLNPRSYVGSLGGGFPYSAQGRLTERFTRTAKDQMLYEFSVDDPGVFTKVWRAEMPMRAVKGPIYEYACHEGNYSLPNILEGARAETRAAALASPMTAPAAR